MNPLRLFWDWKPRKIKCFRATNQSLKQLPILEKRKIQAEVLGPVFREMVEQVGSEKAASILKEAIRKAAIDSANWSSFCVDNECFFHSFYLLQLY